jgi:hypothetical protein
MHFPDFKYLEEYGNTNNLKKLVLNNNWADKPDLGHFRHSQKAAPLGDR